MATGTSWNYGYGFMREYDLLRKKGASHRIALNSLIKKVRRKNKK